MSLENGSGAGVYAAETQVEDDTFMSLESLKVLEGRVDDVLGRHAALVQERDRLRGELQAARQAIAELTAQVEASEKERGQIRAKVESILGRLEGLDLS
jgi:chromosome segregation ATPase